MDPTLLALDTESGDVIRRLDGPSDGSILGEDTDGLWLRVVGGIVLLDPETGEELRRIDTTEDEGTASYVGIWQMPALGSLWDVDRGTGDVHRIDPVSGELVATIPIGADKSCGLMDPVPLTGISGSPDLMVACRGTVLINSITNEMVRMRESGGFDIVAGGAWWWLPGPSGHENVDALGTFHRMDPATGADLEVLRLRPSAPRYGRRSWRATACGSSSGRASPMIRGTPKAPSWQSRSTHWCRRSSADLDPISVSLCTFRRRFADVCPVSGWRDWRLLNEAAPASRYQFGVRSDVQAHPRGLAAGRSCNCSVQPHGRRAIRRAVGSARPIRATERGAGCSDPPAAPSPTPTDAPATPTPDPTDPPEKPDPAIVEFSAARPTSSTASSAASPTASRSATSFRKGRSRASNASATTGLSLASATTSSRTTTTCSITTFRGWKPKA